MQESGIYSAVADVTQRLLQLRLMLNKDQGFQACVDSLKDGQPATFESVWGIFLRAVVISAVGQLLKNSGCHP